MGEFYLSAVTLFVILNIEQDMLIALHREDSSVTSRGRLGT